jgi:formylglycine-generating enzyme required for sulfatase activity/predicted Ser/Thr protein kinase
MVPVQPDDDNEARLSGDDDRADLSGDEGDSLSSDDELDELIRAIVSSPPCSVPTTIEAGTRWGASGRYVIEQYLGSGGMGVVYRAEDTLLKRPVALKLLDVDDDGPTDGLRARLLREAQFAARVEHDRIARVYDVGEHKGSAFVAMEFVRGETLRQCMVNRSMGLADVLALGKQIAEGLAALHDAGVLHRDLKPENVMITEAGAVKLLDFGLARGLEGAPRSEAAEAGGAPAPLTNLSGTPGYMAPEQYAGAPLDARVDIFALGVVLYELVTGERPFRAGTATEAQASMGEPPDLERGPWSQVPEGLRAVVARALDLDPNARFANGAEALAALGQVGVAAEKPVAPPRRVRRVSVAVLALVASTVAAGFALKRSTRKPAAPPPPGMVRIDVGKMFVGRSVEELDRECQLIGPKCDRVVMQREVPAAEVEVAPFLIDVDELTNEKLAPWLNALGAALRVDEDSDDHYPRFVRWGRSTGRGDDLLVDLYPGNSGIEYTSERRFRVLPGREQWPVVQVTWHGARAFCGTQGKRLPTENEWEAAARGAKNRPMPWGVEPARCGGVAVPADGNIIMVPGCEPKVTIEPIGKAAQDVTPEGVRGLAGNVAEWVDAVYVEGNRQARGDGAPDADVPKVIRGGSFAASLTGRTTGRTRRPANAVGGNVGFRCASDG